MCASPPRAGRTTSQRSRRSCVKNCDLYFKTVEAFGDYLLHGKERNYGKAHHKDRPHGGPAAGKTTLVSRVLRNSSRMTAGASSPSPRRRPSSSPALASSPLTTVCRCCNFRILSSAIRSIRSSSPLAAAELVPEDNSHSLRPRADGRQGLRVGLRSSRRSSHALTAAPEERVLANYDMVLHHITCAKGAEFAMTSATTRAGIHRIRARDGRPHAARVERAPESAHHRQ